MSAVTLAESAAPKGGATTLSAHIAKLRKDLGLTQQAVAAAAGVSIAGLRKIEGGAQPRRETLDRLRAALGLPVQPAAPPPAPLQPARIHALYAGALAIIARHYGVAPEEALTRGGEERTGSASWRAAAHARQAALYLVHAVAECGQSEIARAVGISKVAVHQAVRSVEDRRDDPAFDRAMDQAERMLRGEKE